MFSLTHSAARREDSSVPVLSRQTVTVAPPSLLLEKPCSSQKPGTPPMRSLISSFLCLELLGRGSATSCVVASLPPWDGRGGRDPLSNNPQRTRSEALVNASPTRVFTLSGFSRGDHFADAAHYVSPARSGPDVLSHPWSADLARNAIRVFRPGELEDQDQMGLIDLRDASRERLHRRTRAASLRAACTVVSATGSRRRRWLMTT